MTHHQQHHGSYFDVPKTVADPATCPSTNMPSISEDEPSQDADEPPEKPFVHHAFAKTNPPSQARRNSLLTKALHTDSESHTESHDESLGFSSFGRQASRSSTCSTWSAKSDLTSDSGVASTSSSPSHSLVFRRVDFVAEPTDIKDTRSKEQSPSERASISSDKHLQPPQADDHVEEKLARRRCISFACGAQTKSIEAHKGEPAPRHPERANTAPVEPEQPKRSCLIKFACPSKVSYTGLDKDKAAKATARRPSPPPPSRVKSPSPAPIRHRGHRGSDSTIKEESPRTARKVPPLEPRRSFFEEPEPEHEEESTFHAFAGKTEKIDDWVEEKTVHRSRLTVDDTLTKEKDLQQLGEEAEEEAREEENDDFDNDDDLDSEDDPVSEGGFQTDDEDGFAESDDDSDGDSDYEWWAPKRSAAPSDAARPAPGDSIRLPAAPIDSDDSNASSISPKNSRLFRDGTPRRKVKSKAEPVAIRPPTPELPDSTDFVCGTLDEDKPLEEAYASIIQQRKAAKHHARPQDIDPTFPTDMASDDDDDDEEENIRQAPRDDSDQAHFLHGSIEDIDHEVSRGRKPFNRGRSPRPSPPRTQPTAHSSIFSMVRHKSPNPPPSHAATQRLPRSPVPPPKTTKRAKSPMPMVGGNAAGKSVSKKGQVLRSPPPRPLFSHSPRRNQSPRQSRPISPPPSRRGSSTEFKPTPFGTAFLGHRPSLTHTASLPRSPNLFGQARNPYERLMPETASNDDVDDDDGEDTAKENIGGYERGAIDIVQGLERKRLRRRQRFYERYCRKEDKKAQRREAKRPQPGKGAQRMRQVGIECAIYRGKRVLSV